MNKVLQNTLIVGIVVVSFSLLWALVWVPYAKDRDFEACLSDVENTLERKHAEIESHIADLERQKIIAQKEADEKLEVFLRENPEPKYDVKVKNNLSVPKNYSGYATWDDISKNTTEEDLQKSRQFLEKRDKWNLERESIVSEAKSLEDQIQNIKTDLQKVEKEKGESDETCYKKFK